jgi:hypothetical protein
MMDKAALHGLAFRAKVTIDGNVHESPVSDSYREFMYGAYRVAKFGRRYYREIGRAVEEKGNYLVNTINESIDASVFDRWRQKLEYRPPNLVRWAHNYGVNPNDLHTTVRADDCQVAITD